MKTTPKTETVPESNIVPSQQPSVGRIPSRSSLGTMAGCACQNASLLAALWARKLAGFDGDLVSEQRPTITATIAMFFLPVTRNAATAMVIF